MKIAFRTEKTAPLTGSLLVVPCYTGETGAVIDGDWRGLHDVAQSLLDSGDFRATADSTKIIYPAGKRTPTRMLLVGLGNFADATGETLRRFGGIAASNSRTLEGRVASVLLPSAGKGLDAEARAQAVSEGVHCGAYTFDDYKTANQNGARRMQRVELVAKSGAEGSAARRGFERGALVAGGMNLCREIGNLPGNDFGPVEFAERARREARATGLRVKIFDEKALRKERMGALLGVASGSARPARMIQLEYVPRGKTRGAPLVFVGKAITFDSGGISLKPADGMQDMKFDMCGGAAVLGAMSAIARLKPKRRVIGLIASAENMPSGTAIRPGDILKSSSGLTIEIINTDAEGRLVLADALHYAKRFKPGLVIDLATLTGACVVALGAVNAGLFSKDRELAEKLRKLSAEVGERFWPMPLDDAYQELIRSDVADVKNSGGRWAGAVSAAAFLSRFIDGFPWAHLDIAGTAWTDKEGGYLSKGATGCGVRTLVKLAETPL